MPEEIMQNIHRIPVPLPGNPLKELNAYLIRGKDRNLLIDTGFRQPACREALFAGLRELGLRRGDVDVLLTHLHSDHAGLAPEAAGETGTIFVSWTTWRSARSTGKRRTTGSGRRDFPSP